MGNKVYVLSIYDSGNAEIESYAFTSKERAEAKLDKCIHAWYDEDVKEIVKSAIQSRVEFNDGSELILKISEVILNEE